MDTILTGQIIEGMEAALKAPVLDSNHAPVKREMISTYAALRQAVALESIADSLQLIVKLMDWYDGKLSDDEVVKVMNERDEQAARARAENFS